LLFVPFDQHRVSRWQSNLRAYFFFQRPPNHYLGFVLNQSYTRTDIAIKPLVGEDAGTFRTTTLSTISVRSSSAELCCPLLQNYSVWAADRSG